MDYLRYFMLGLFFPLVLLASCDRMDSVYQEFISDGPVTYMSKLTGVEASSGENRVKFTIPAQTDPRIKGVMVYWDNRTQHQDVPLNITEPNEFIIENVAEGSHIFELVTHDEKGNNSLSVSVAASSYGDSFRAYASTSEVTSASRNQDGSCLFQIRHSFSPRYQYMELMYRSAEGKEKTLVIERGTTSLSVADFAGEEYSYRSVFLPDETAFEYIYSVSTKKTL